ncbi:MAG: LPS biosynthesis protein WbpP [Elusimicrobia bacterium CG08_land_8_20_14_0_20_51_18]|nr:MAG: LPS biosynthesis protein WbpP [Elusimicrobia bacterium CG08_land_8_20_14_0_20_51_18]
MAKKLWLVTGGAGFIGSNIVEELLSRKEKVRILDNFSTGKMEHIEESKGRIEIVRGDIRNPSDIKRAMKGVSYVLHQAALRSVPKSVDNPTGTNEVNVTGTLNVLIGAKEAGVKRLVYASSSSAYGDNKVFPQKETLRPSPISPYAVSKLAAENYCVMFSKTYGLETVALRYFNVFGPKQDPESMYSAVIPKFIELAALRKPLIVHWDGKQSRDFTYVKNVADVNILAALSPVSAGKVYNVAVGNTISLLQIAGMLEELCGYGLKKTFTPKRKGDIRKTWADVSLMKRDLKYKPRVLFREGLENTWKWFRLSAKGGK